MIDTDEVRKDIAVKFGIVLAKDDPIFASVMLHDHVLEKHINLLSEHYAAYTRELAASLSDQKSAIDNSKLVALDQIQKQANVSTDFMVQRFVSTITDTAKAEAAKAIEPVKKAAADELGRLEKAARSLGSEADYSRDRWKLCAYSAGAASLFSTVLVLLIVIFAGPLGLNAEEKRNLNTGAALHAVWSKLDSKTRDRVDAELKQHYANEK
ncbi:hypothetical protein ACNDVF_004992 [Escherichia coli]|nr:hypothetical protein [Klebsiella pneumoniae]